MFSGGMPELPDEPGKPAGGTEHKIGVGARLTGGFDSTGIIMAHIPLERESMTEMRIRSDRFKIGPVDEELCARSGALKTPIRALILLSGVVRPTRLSDGLQRSILDLPIDDELTLFDLWRGHAAMLSRALQVKGLPVRILTNGGGGMPTSLPSDQQQNIRVEIDTDEYRGTGGLLRDLVEAYEDDDYVVLANGNQLLVDSLAKGVLDLLAVGGDVGLVAHQDGRPAGLMLIRCGALGCISSEGFVDLKEQALPQMARSCEVKVLEREAPMALPIRTREDYLCALLEFHRDRPQENSPQDPFMEEWRPVFSLAETGADVAPSARIHNSVVLRGARVEGGATVVSSVICPGAIARSGKVITDRVLSSRNGRGGTGQ